MYAYIKYVSITYNMYIKRKGTNLDVGRAMTPLGSATGVHKWNIRFYDVTTLFLIVGVANSF